MYTGAVAILVESSALYSVFGVMYLVPYAMGAPIADLFGQLWTKMSVSYQKPFQVYPNSDGLFLKVISPLLIILRVVKGRAWSADITATSRTSLAFASQSAGTTLADGRSQFALKRFSSSTSMT